MTTRVQKWGNSLGLRIPKPYAEEAGIEADSAVEITVRDGIILITPKRDKKRTLKEIVAGIDEEICHRESDWGEPVGREIW